MSASFRAGGPARAAEPPASPSAAGSDGMRTGGVVAPGAAGPSVEAGASGTGRVMTAIVQRGYGAPEQVLRMVRVAVPEAGDDDVLVRVRATSVNTPDWLVTAGVPGILRLAAGLRRPNLQVRGSDLAGVVAAVGANVTDLRPGDEVFGSLWTGSLGTGHGTFAEYTVVPAAQVIPKPARLSWEEAGAAVMSGLTALLASRDVGQVGPGTRVLVNGASGGVGTFAVQFARALGAHVTGVCGPRNVELVRSLGAERVIDYTKEDFTRETGRYDLVLDNVLNHPPKVTARALVPGGIYIPNSIGSPTGLLGSFPRIARARLMSRRGAVDVRAVQCVVNRENLAALAAFLVSGDVRVVIDRTYPLAEAAAAVAHMMTHRARGQIVIAG